MDFGETSEHRALRTAVADIARDFGPAYYIAHAGPVESSPGRVEVPLGRIVGARSGDMGGNANVGLWARDDRAYEWLRRELTVDRFRKLLTEAAHLGVQRYELPNLRALNFVVAGLLAPGVAAITRPDARPRAWGSTSARASSLCRGTWPRRSPAHDRRPPPASPAGSGSRATAISGWSGRPRTGRMWFPSAHDPH